MPESQPSVPATPAAIPVAVEAAASVRDDPDYAFGCECADPALQIAHWGAEARGDGA